jgi:hypothetical protein
MLMDMGEKVTSEGDWLDKGVSGVLDVEGSEEGPAVGTSGRDGADGAAVPDVVGSNGGNSTSLVRVSMIVLEGSRMHEYSITYCDRQWQTMQRTLSEHSTKVLPSEHMKDQSRRP